MADQISTNLQYKNILSKIKLVVLLGTPNSGSWLSSVTSLPVVRGLIRPTAMTNSLRNDNPETKSLLQWYRTNVPEHIDHLVFTESRKMFGLINIVSPSSGDPGVPRVNPIPIDADHSAICKPKDRQSLVYKTIVKAVEQIVNNVNVARTVDGWEDGRDVKGVTNPTVRRSRSLQSRMVAHKEALVVGAEDRPFTILLCGPSRTQSADSGAFELNVRLCEALRSDGFDVVLGGEDGVSNPRLGADINTLGRELDFLENHCNAVIVIATGISSWTEVGVFSRHIYNDKKMREKKIDIVVLAESKDIRGESFIRSGAIAYVEGVGRADLIEHREYDVTDIVIRMRARRSVYNMDRRGRPRKAVA